MRWLGPAAYMSLGLGLGLHGVKATDYFTIDDLNEFEADAEAYRFSFNDGLSHEAERMAAFRQKREAEEELSRREKKAKTREIFDEILDGIQVDSSAMDVDEDSTTLDSVVEDEKNQEIRLVNSMRTITLAKVLDENKSVETFAENIDMGKHSESNSGSNALGGDFGGDFKPRSFTSSDMIGLTGFNEIWRYGCWCSFGQSILFGRGEPKDAVDQACRELTLAMRCIRHDTQNTTCTSDCDNNCNVLDIEYSRPVSRDGETIDTSSYVQCARSNKKSKCRTWTCAVETDFAKKLVDFFFESVQLNTNFMHSNGFEPNAQCGSSEEYGSWSHINPLNDEKKPGNWEENEILNLVADFMSTKSNGQNGGDGNSDGGGKDKFSCCGNYPNRKMISDQMYGCCEDNSSVNSMGLDGRFLENIYTKSRRMCCEDGRIEDIGSC